MVRPFCVLAAKETKAIDHGPCLQGSLSSKPPPSRGLDLLVSTYHLPTAQPCPPNQSPWSTESGEWSTAGAKKWLITFSNDSVPAGTWPQNFGHQAKQPAFSLLDAIFSPLAGLLKARQSKEMHFIYDWVNNQLLWWSMWYFLIFIMGRLCWKCSTPLAFMGPQSVWWACSGSNKWNC